MNAGRRVRRVFLLACLLALVATAGSLPAREGSRRGLTIHFDFFNTREGADRLLAKSVALGAGYLNVVPPPHVWEHPQDLVILRRIFAFAGAHGQKVVITRIDASATAPTTLQRYNYLYSRILNRPGLLPDGKPTPSFFLATVANPAYEQWLEEETRYYAREFAREPTLAAFSCGLLNEPFVSQRGSLLCFSEKTNRYEIAQYTPFMQDYWHRYLQRAFGGDLPALNTLFVSSYSAFSAVPMPKGASDPAFGRSDRAYRTFCRAVNAWVVRQIDRIGKTWREQGGGRVPLALQLSGYVAEKFQLGAPTLTELDLDSWIRRTDLLGLSLYTNADYPDRGHASVEAMVEKAIAVAKTGKPVLVLECGTEDEGARADEREFAFLAAQARRVSPRCLIYEFTQEAYNETQAHRDGKLFDQTGRFRPDAARAVERLWNLAGAKR